MRTAHDIQSPKERKSLPKRLSATIGSTKRENVQAYNIVLSIFYYLLPLSSTTIVIGRRKYYLLKIIMLAQ